MIARNRFCHVKATIVMAAAMMVMWLFHQTAQAKTTVMLDDENSISFLSGQLDANSFNGEIFSVEFLNDGEVFATADRVLLKADGPHKIIEQFEADNVAASDDDVYFTAQSIRVSHVPFGWLLDEAERAPFNLLAWQQVAYQVVNLEIVNEASGIALSVPTINTTPVEVGQLSNGAPYLTSLGFNLPLMKIQPIGESDNAREFGAWLDRANLSHFSLSFESHQQNMLQGADVLTDTMIQVRLSGLVEFLLRSEFYTPEEDFSRFSDSLIWPDEIDDYTSFVASNTKLGSFQIDLTDFGLLEFVEQTGELPPSPILAEQLRGLMASFLPETGDALADPISKFITEGGALSLSARPAEPFKVEDLAIALFMPDFVVRQIKLTATHTP